MNGDGVYNIGKQTSDSRPEAAASTSKFKEALERRRSGLASAELTNVSTKKMMKNHSRGSPSLPRVLIDTVATIQPTSSPAGRALNKARCSRSSFQERDDGERFCSYIFLRESFGKNKPHEQWRISMKAKQAIASGGIFPIGGKFRMGSRLR